MMKYVSTRGGGSPCSFTDVLLAGMAPDGGLYVPESWPALDTALLSHLQGLSYAEVAMQVISPFIGDAIDKATLKSLFEETYEGGAFDHSGVAPLVQLGPNSWLLELFHGPTLSFKDYAMQLLGRLFDHVLEERGERVTIVGATSGDTGSAAIEACRGCKNIDIFILHPKGRTSEVQRRQMTTVDAPNVHNIALDGNFDDCQAVVKGLFADKKLREALKLSAVNSINWARIMAQIVYYFVAALALGAPGRAVSFTVPTGNFGNVYAAYAARRMGLPIKKLGIATNRNDILTRFFESGEMKIDKVMPSLSPSMDIQVSSNFERYLYELMNSDAQGLARLMSGFRQKRAFSLGDALMQKARGEFHARRCGDLETMAVMKSCYEETGILIDPHTAVALHGAMQIMEGDPSVPMVVLACAHPAKFPEAVAQATGAKAPEHPRLAGIMKKAEHFIALPDDLAQVARYIQGQSRK